MELGVALCAAGVLKRRRSQISVRRRRPRRTSLILTHGLVDLGGLETAPLAHTTERKFLTRTSSRSGEVARHLNDAEAGWMDPDADPAGAKELFLSARRLGHSRVWRGSCLLRRITFAGQIGRPTESRLLQKRLMRGMARCDWRSGRNGWNHQQRPESARRRVELVLRSAVGGDAGQYVAGDAGKPLESSFGVHDKATYFPSRSARVVQSILRRDGV
jgi:hypothetical protein